MRLKRIIKMSIHVKEYVRSKHHKRSILNKRPCFHMVMVEAKLESTLKVDCH